MSFKIAVIGCGQISMSHHGPSYQKYAEAYPDTELAACCDLLPERAELFSRRFGFKAAYTDWREMLSVTRPDAVCLNVPPDMTAAIACEVLNLGVPLHLEKPPGLNTVEVDQIIAAADASRTPHQVAFNRRFMPLIAQLKRLLEEGQSGQALQHLHYNFCRYNRSDPDFSTTAIHGIDAARFIMGSDYASVNFSYKDLPEVGPGVANFYLDCVFKSGATAQLAFCPMAGMVIERAEVHARDHSYFLQTPIFNGFDYPGTLLHVSAGGIVEQFGGIQLAGSGEDFIMSGFYQENVSFFEDIRAGRRPACDVHSGRQSVLIAEYVRQRRASVTF